MRKKMVQLGFLLMVTVVVGVVWVDRSSAPVAPIHSQGATDSRPSFNKRQYSLTDPASPWVIVNKQHPLVTRTYQPADLVFPAVSLRIPGMTEMKMRQEAATALEAFLSAADAAGYAPQVSTAFRGYQYQKTLYDGYVATEGQAAADTQSARPGYSEHQTGWAVDIRTQSAQCYLEVCYGNMPEGKWLAANAYEYGFLLRYPADKVSVTGYSYEPWHFRYVGKGLTEEMHNQGVTTLEEFFGVSGGTTYKDAP
ncbi:MAG: D-alanyl-D-alanine carboxypeptidase [Candidatus Saccharibacteria bacterium]|nr:D-alanyl-D-alanine carboxypeptidase [Candidatus Saccharibacteria bacterium]